MKKGKFKKIILVLLSLLIAAAMITGGAVWYLQKQASVDKATVILTLNYENSSQGLNPDNSKFNLRFFKGEDVLNVALQSTKIDQYLTANELAGFISIKGVSSKKMDVNSDNKYIDSTYKITLNLPKEYSQFVTAKMLLGEICEAYKEWFVKNYVIDSKALIIQTDNFDEMEYSVISSYLDMMAMRGKNYLSAKEASSSAFVGEDGTTWKSLRQELSNLTEYDIHTFNQYIWENGIAKDKAWAVTVLEHKNADLSIDYTLYLANVEKYGKVVDEYRNEMTSSVLIPTYDDKEQFYMSRTKTGIDDISKSMDNYLGMAVALKEKLDINSDKILKLNASEMSSTERADIMLKNIQLKIIGIFEKIQKLDEEYVNGKTDGYIKYSFVEDSGVLGFLGL